MVRKRNFNQKQNKYKSSHSKRYSSKYGRKKCPKCGNPGSHFIPAKNGHASFYVCQTVKESEDESST